LPTTRGFKEEEFRLIGKLICETLDGLAANREDNSAAEKKVRAEIGNLCKKFPVYQGLM